MQMRSSAFFVLLVALACGSPASEIKDISPQDLLSMSPDSVLILDVRTPKEFQSGHVPQAVNIPLDQLDARLDDLASSQDMPVVVYCERGGRAGKAASLLSQAGFTDIQHLEGDMSEWRASGRPTATE
jgi:rhodanese-related sulfurtransferase